MAVFVTESAILCFQIKIHASCLAGLIRLPHVQPPPLSGPFDGRPHLVGDTLMQGPIFSCTYLFFKDPTFIMGLFYYFSLSLRWLHLYLGSSFSFKIIAASIFFSGSGNISWPYLYVGSFSIKGGP